MGAPGDILGGWYSCGVCTEIRGVCTEISTCQTSGGTMMYIATADSPAHSRACEGDHMATTRFKQSQQLVHGDISWQTRQRAAHQLACSNTPPRHTHVSYLVTHLVGPDTSSSLPACVFLQLFTPNTAAYMPCYQQPWELVGNAQELPCCSTDRPGKHTGNRDSSQIARRCTAGCRHYR